MSYCRSTKRKLRLYKFYKRKRSPVTVKGCKKARTFPSRDWLFEATNPKRIGDEVIIELPKVIDIHNPRYRPDIIMAVRQMHSVGKGRILRLDFSNVEKVMSGGMLLFYAEFRNIVNSRQGIKAKVIYPNNSKVLQVLKQIRLFEFINTECNVVPRDDDVVHWRFSHGTEVDAKSIGDGVEEGILPSEISKKLQGGMNEAVTNVIHHGYKYKQRSLSLVKIEAESWWMFSQVKDGQLTVVICDLGIGIPESLPYSYGNAFWDLVKKRRLIFNDAAKIKLAIDERLSATKKMYRGIGLKRIAELAKVVPNSYVIIYSNKGAYTSTDGTGEAKNYRDSINGTIICFSFPIEKGVTHE